MLVATSFGLATVNEDPDGDAVPVVVNIRFPGQYFDVETGTHYNYYRDYDPKTGRYVESDPIGIQQGENHLYVYVQNNPVNFIDPLGLQGFDPGPNPVDPQPERRRLPNAPPFLPLNLADRHEYCPPYYFVKNGVLGLIPLTSVEEEKAECWTVVRCYYFGQIGTYLNPMTKKYQAEVFSKMLEIRTNK